MICKVAVQTTVLRKIRFVSLLLAKLCEKIEHFTLYLHIYAPFLSTFFIFFNCRDVPPLFQRKLTPL